jgi:hypothetical protein
MQVRHLTTMQDELAVNSYQLAVVSTDPPEVTAGFRAGLAAIFTWQDVAVGLLESKRAATFDLTQGKELGAYGCSPVMNRSVFVSCMQSRGDQ